MEYFRHEDRQMAYLRRGPDPRARGTAVVFLHNGGTSHAIWQPQLEALAGEFPLLAPDLPGYGESELPASCALPDYVRLLDAFLRAQLGDSPAILVGNCMGSAIALEFARRQPQRVRALVLLNPLTAATFASGGLGVLRHLHTRLPGLTPWLTRGAGALKIPPALVGTLLRLQFGARGRQLRLGDKPALRACYRAPSAPAALAGLFATLPDYASLDRLEGGAGLPPVYTLWGRQNRVLSAAAGAALNRRLRPRQALVLDDCGHLLMQERPEVVCEVIRRAAWQGQAAAKRHGAPARSYG